MKSLFSQFVLLWSDLQLSLQVFVNFAKQQSREDDTIVLHPKAAGAQRYIETTAIKSYRK